MVRSGGFLAPRGRVQVQTAGRSAWALYEFGSGPFYIVVNIFVFQAYFAVGVVGDVVLGQAYWGYVTAAVATCVAISSPVLGSVADAYGARKPFVAVFTLLALIPMSFLVTAGPGLILYTAALIVGATLLMEGGSLFHSAMLPFVAGRRVGFWSSLGYALNYAGAILGFGLFFALPALELVPAGDTTSLQERMSGPLAAVWMAIFLLPLLIFTPDAPRSGLRLHQAAGQGLSALWRTLRGLKAYGNIARFLIARMIYYDGLTAVFSFVSVYSTGVFGWSIAQVSLNGLIVLVTAAASAVAGGLIDDRIGSRRTILIALSCFVPCFALSMSITPGTWLYVVPVSAELSAAGLPGIGPWLAAVGFPRFEDQAYVLAGLAGGLFIGPALASSRTMLARIAPLQNFTQFFGLYNLTGRATAFLAPLLIGLMTQASGNQRAGLFVIFAFVIAGALLMISVREERSL